MYNVPVQTSPTCWSILLDVILLGLFDSVGSCWKMLDQI